MATEQTAPTNLLQRAQMIAIANRQRQLNKEAERRIIAKAVQEAIKNA